MFQSHEFITAWQEWKEHKAEKSGYPYTSVAERKALATLFKTVHGSEELAIKSIAYSIERNWAYIYIKPKEENERESTTEIRSSVQSEFNKRYGG